MDTIIDVQEVQTELDRAARDAQSGPDDVRAGRFVHEVAERVNSGVDRPAASKPSSRPTRT
jgi:hypothetical protein